MKRKTWKHPIRRGAVAVLVALVLPVLLMLASFTTDVAMMAVTRAQLSTAADSAALAGAVELLSNGRISSETPDLSSEIANARTWAVQFASYNETLGKATSIDPNDSNSPTGDVVIGYLDPTRLGDPLNTLNTDASMTPLFNSVRVTTQRTSERNGLIPAAFGRVMGFNGYGVKVRSTATIQRYDIAGFDASASRVTSLIPIVLSDSVYQAMLDSNSSHSSEYYDSYSYDRDTGAVSPGGDGIRESDLYPVYKGPGNWGTVRIGVSQNGTSTLADQIANGVNTDVMSPAYGSTMTASTTSPLTLSGNPGISLGIKSAVQSRIGQNVIIPIYDSSSGQGSNFTYSIIGFAPVTVLDFKANGSNSTITIQPGYVTEPAAIAGSPISSGSGSGSGSGGNGWTNGGLIRIYLSQ